MYAYIDYVDFADLEDALDNDNEVDPASLEDIIDDRMEDLLDNFKDAKCKKHIEKDLRKQINMVTLKSEKLNKQINRIGLFILLSIIFFEPFYL